MDDSGVALERWRSQGAPGMARLEGAPGTSWEESCRAEFRPFSFPRIHAGPDPDGCADVDLAQGAAQLSVVAGSGSRGLVGDAFGLLRTLRTTTIPF